MKIFSRIYYLIEENEVTNMKKDFRLFFDMDDTLTDFSKGDSEFLTKMYEEGYFLDLKPFPFLNEVNKIAAFCPENIFIISACLQTPFCRKEKTEWLKKNLPAAMKENILFTRVGKAKHNFVKWKLHRKIDKYDILIDDYSKNLIEWENAGGTAIKFKNGFNTKDPSKYKYIISNFSELLDVITIIRNDLEEERKCKH